MKHATALLVSVFMAATAGAQEDQFSTVITPAFSPITWERLVDARNEPNNWLMYSGTLDSQRYSLLDSINTDNVGQLEMKWAYQIPVIDRAETVPLVVDGIMFITEAPSNVVAVDARTGREYWRYDHEMPDDLRICCGRNNRGVAILGETLFMSTLDAHLVAIDARTGNLIDVAGLSKDTNSVLSADAETSVEEEWGWTGSVSVDDAAELSKSSVVIDLIDNLVVEALTVKASDIHLEPKARHLRVRFRMDGLLTDRPSIPNGYKAAVLSRTKIIAAMDIAERRVPQDGGFSMKFRGRRVDFRVSTFPTKHGEVIVIRILDRSGLKLELATLGFPERLASRIRTTVKKPNGILLVTGPTDSGKTSTLYACLKEMDSSTKKIITLEDPVEYDLPDICQGQANERAGFTFAKGLRSILRQDPDAIMVGEIRDTETAQIAI